MSTVAESIEAVKELPETEKGVLFRERDPLREPDAPAEVEAARVSCDFVANRSRASIVPRSFSTNVGSMLLR